MVMLYFRRPSRSRARSPWASSFISTFPFRRGHHNGARTCRSIGLLPTGRWAIFRGIILACGCLLGLTHLARGGTPVPWPDQSDLTPESLTHFFSDFTYELGDQVQDGRVFVERKRGDCDDFAKLVSEILSRHGYTTKLVVVMMAKQTHVVCYVKERQGYLDYNLRAASRPIVACDGSLEDIAEKVAASFHARWHMASEIRYQGTRPIFVFNTFPSAPTNSLPPVQLPAKSPAVPTAPQAVAVAAVSSAEKRATSKVPPSDLFEDAGKLGEPAHQPAIAP
jgi:hypothetical protein